jgi:ATP-dependent DNA ligase
MNFIYPDKPGLSSPGQLLPAWILRDEKSWLCQAKGDGWRCQILWKRGRFLRLLSRSGQPLPVAPGVREALEQALRPALADALRIDAEWMTPRRGAPVEGFWLLDLLERDSAAYWDVPAGERFHLLQLYAPADLVVPSAKRDFQAFADAARAGAHGPQVEGVVLKRRSSRHLGGASASAQNPDWIKIKWNSQTISPAATPLPMAA